MKTLPNGEHIYTTGEVAKLCGVSMRTVSNWMDTGRLNGYRLPGSRDRRVPLTGLREFMHKTGYPPSTIPGHCRALVVGSPPPEVVRAIEAAGVEVAVAASEFDAGELFADLRPGVVAVEAAAVGRLAAAWIAARATAADAASVAVISDSDPFPAGFDDVAIGFNDLPAKVARLIGPAAPPRRPRRKAKA